MSVYKILLNSFFPHVVLATIDEAYDNIYRRGYTLEKVILIKLKC